MIQRTAVGWPGSDAPNILYPTQNLTLRKCGSATRGTISGPRYIQVTGIRVIGERQLTFIRGYSIYAGTGPCIIPYIVGGQNTYWYCKNNTRYQLKRVKTEILLLPRLRSPVSHKYFVRICYTPVARRAYRSTEVCLLNQARVVRAGVHYGTVNPKYGTSTVWKIHGTVYPRYGKSTAFSPA